MNTRILAYFIKKERKNFLISNNLGEQYYGHNLKEILDFFLQGEADFRVCWNLYQIVGIVQDLAPQSVYKELIEKDKVWFEDYKLFSSQGRKFSITHAKHLHGNFFEPCEVDLFHLAQYFPDESVNSAQEVYDKTVELLKVLDELGMHPTRLSSAISIYQECILQAIDLPNVYNLPDDNAIETSEYAHRIGWRELRAVYQVGHFENAWDCDLNGAYSSVMQNLPDTRFMKCWFGKKYQKCDLGIFRGKVTITSDFSPLVNSEGIPYKGTCEDYITTEQWAFLNKYKLGHFEPIDGWMINFTSPDKPYFELMNDLYEARGESGLYKRIPKAIATGVGGRLAQEYPDKYGDYFNPILSALTTSRVSMLVADMILKSNLQEHLISLIVDGCLLDTDPKIPTGTKLGEWRYEQVKALVLSMGFSWSGDKKPNGETYETMINAIKANPNKSYINGIFINSDLSTNRKFDKFPRTGRDLLEYKSRSRAIEVVKCGKELVMTP